GPPVWVVAEMGPRGPKPVTAELLAKAAELAARLGAPVEVLVLGDGAEHAAALAAAGADRVLVAEGAGLVPYTTDAHAAALTEAIRSRAPRLVLVPSTARGRDLAPRVAARLGLGLTGDAAGDHGARGAARGGGCRHARGDRPGLAPEAAPSGADRPCHRAAPLRRHRAQRRARARGRAPPRGRDRRHQQEPEGAHLQGGRPGHRVGLRAAPPAARGGAPRLVGCEKRPPRWSMRPSRDLPDFLSPPSR